MAKILFGGPQEKERGKPSKVHDDLVARLKEEGHEVTYVIRGDHMIGELNFHSLEELRTSIGLPTELYDLVIYDTGLFYDLVEPAEKKAALFCDLVVGYLSAPRAPVIVLAEKELSGLIKDASEKAGFMQIDQPYKVEKVISDINSL